MMNDLTIAVKAEYFDQIKAGIKLEEFRLKTDYWHKRLVGRTYRNVVITKGYPKRDDASRRLVFPWRGYVERSITHKHFGADTVEVFAIRVEGVEER